MGNLQEELVYDDGGGRAVIKSSVFNTLSLETLLDIQMEMPSRQIFRPVVQGRPGLWASANSAQAVSLDEIISE